MSGTPRRVNPYRIFVSVTEAESDGLSTALVDLYQKSFDKKNLLLTGKKAALEEELTNLHDDQIAIVPVSGSSHNDAFVEICNRFQDRDFLFVKASTSVPEFWDLRLAWSAVRRRGVATVSPLSDGNASTNASPVGGFTDTDIVDRICYESSRLEASEVTDFLRDCFYVCAEALRVTLGQFPDLSGEAMCKFAEAARKLNYAHLLADHLYVGSVAGVRNRTATNGIASSRKTKVVEALHYTASKHKVDWRPPSIVPRLKPRQLHVMHTWGGGLEKWVTEYCRADKTHQNFVLKSVGNEESFGRELRLFRDIDDPMPIQTWSLSPAIKGTAIAHTAYDTALSESLDHYGIDRVLVSSLIGHSLNVLASSRPTIMICHDYYPFCPALNITFENVCTVCTHDRLTACTVSNPYNRFFHNLAPDEWAEIRAVFSERIRRAGIRMVAPSPSVAKSYTALVPEFADHFRVIPHGARPITRAPLDLRQLPSKFRIVIPGRLAKHKGLELFKQIREELSTFAEILLVGCGVEGETLRHPRVSVISEYAWEDLSGILQEFQPDVGLLLSVVPETFSYTLQELQELGIPPVTTRMGSFEDRIEHGVNGFLCEPTADALLACLRRLAGDPLTLANVRASLSQSRFRTVEEMLEDYADLLANNGPSANAYFCNDVRTGPVSIGSKQPGSSERDVSPYDRLIALAEADVQHLQQTIAERDKAIVSTKGEVERFRRAFAAMEMSRSWRLTSPARKAVSIVRRAASLPLKLVHQIIQASRGTLPE